MRKIRAISTASAIVAVTVGAVVVGATLANASNNVFTHSATGTVFFPNPVTALGNQNLTDNKDAGLGRLRRRLPSGDPRPPGRVGQPSASTCG